MLSKKMSFRHLSMFLVAVVITSPVSHARQVINFANLDQVSDNQIIYTFLKNGYFSKTQAERAATPFRYELSKCTLEATSLSDAKVTFKFILKSGKKLKIAASLDLQGSALDAGNEMPFVIFFRRQMKSLECMTAVSLPAQMDRNAVAR